MMTPHEILWGVVFPSIIAIVAMMLAHLPPWRRNVKIQPWGPAIAIACAFATAFTGVGGWPSFPPIETQNWLPFLAIAVGIVSVVATAMPRDWVVHSILSIALIVATAWLLVRTGSTPPAAQWLTIGGVIAALAIWWAAMELLARQSPGAGLPILLALFVVAAAIVLADSGILSFAKIAGGVALAVGLIGAAGLWFRDLSLSRGGVLALAVLLMGLIVCARPYLVPRDLIVLVLAPLALWVGQLPVINRRPWRRFLVAGAAMLIVLSIALIPAVKGLAKTMKEETQSYQY